MYMYILNAYDYNAYVHIRRQIYIHAYVEGAYIIYAHIYDPPCLSVRQ